jgi:hypothetical protein
MLEKVAGTAAGELVAWQEFKKNASWDGGAPAPKLYDPEAYQLVEENFRKQEISLSDYIRFREKTIISEKTP